MARTKQQIKDSLENSTIAAPMADQDTTALVVSGVLPTVDAPTVETPTVETPTVETPTVETPTVETPTDGTPTPVAITVSAGALALSRVQRGVPYSGFIRLTGASYHANPNSDRGRAWATLQDGGNVAEWCRVAKAAGNRGCGVGDIEILATKWSAVVVTDAVGNGLYPASAIGKVYGVPPVVKW
jgi:hypothetical protein